MCWSSWCARSGDKPDMRSAEGLGRLVAQLHTLRRMSVSVNGMLQAGKEPVVEGSIVKDMGTVWEQKLPDRVRELAAFIEETEGNRATLEEQLRFATMIAPKLTIQGGTTEVLRGIIARGLGRCAECPTSQKLLWPTSVAIIGASSDTRGLRGRIVQIMRSHPYAGAVYPVSRSETEVQGLQGLQDRSPICRPADLAALIIPAQFVPQELEHCGAAGIKAAIILSSGFAEEKGETGPALQREVQAIAKQYDMAVSGPNGEGFANTAAALCPTFSPAMDAGDVPLLHDSLMARLDRLSAGKRVAQLGAVLGRQFTYALLRAVAPWDEPTLQRALGQLVDAELLYPRGSPPEATYQFKHALIQEAAYQSLLTRTRQQYHQHIAQALAAHFPETAETQPELLAHHYTEAGLQAQALPYWHQAGQRAIARSAYAEARQHLTTGLEVLVTVPETPARHQHELDLLTALARVLGVTKGQAAPELEPVLTRAMALAQQVGKSAQSFAVLRARWSFSNVRSEHQAAHTVAEQLLDLAQRQHDPALLLGAHHALGVTCANMGLFALARTHHERGIALCDARRHATLHTLPGSLSDHAVSFRAMVAWVLWELGYPDQAMQRGQEALCMAQALAHPYTLVEALRYRARLHALRREWQTAQAHAETQLTLATKHGFARHVALGMFFRGWALAAQGQGAEGIAQMRQSLDASRAMGGVGGLEVPALAEAYGQVGQVDEGLHLLVEELARVGTTGGRHRAERHRLHGELLLRQTVPEVQAAEACFQQALDAARQRQAKSWELRAAMSLSRLWQRQGKRAAAYELLAPIYGWFTEGFDTADLQEAKALLQELA